MRTAVKVVNICAKNHGKCHVPIAKTHTLAIGREQKMIIKIALGVVVGFILLAVLCIVVGAIGVGIVHMQDRINDMKPAEHWRDRHE